MWIASGANVLHGVTIGDGAVVGAGSIVTKDVPPYAIVVGNPARILKYRFDDKIIEELLKIKWWDFSDEVIKGNIELFESSITMETIQRLKELKK